MKTKPDVVFNIGAIANLEQTLCSELLCLNTVNLNQKAFRNTHPATDILPGQPPHPQTTISLPVGLIRAKFRRMDDRHIK